MARKTLSLKTKLASALLALGHVPYDHAKEMTADQLISLYQFDHGMLHESGHPQRDMYWNITPRLIKAHRDKTRQDAAIIAKGRRIRAKRDAAGAGIMACTRITGVPTADRAGWTASENRSAVGSGHSSGPHIFKRKLRSRGFDKRYRRRMDGTVTKR